MSKVAEIVTEKIIEALDQGVVPWRQPWRASGQDVARSAWGKPYRGVNVWLLALSRAAGGFASNTWLTFKQVAAQGGTVRPGAKGTLVVFWKVGDRTIVVDPETGKSKVSRPFMLRYFTVFNLDQTHGVTLTAAQAKVENKRTEGAGIDLNPLDDAEAIVGTYFAMDGAPTLTLGSDRAFYSPVLDAISVPDKSQYEYRSVPATDGAADDIDAVVAPEFYSTLFHEIGHSTGHKSRCNRDGIDNFDHFGSEQYAKEELVAELTSAFLCAEAGIDNTLQNSAAYIANWKSRLQDDPNLIVRASGQAQKAMDFVLGTSFEKEEQEAA
jgi:antirestriction protein ArdC